MHSSSSYVENEDTGYGVSNKNCKCVKKNVMGNKLLYENA